MVKDHNHNHGHKYNKNIYKLIVGFGKEEGRSLCFGDQEIKI